MKNIFGLKKDKSSIAYDIDGKLFRTNTICYHQERMLDDDLQFKDEHESKGSLPTYLSFIKYVSFVIGMIGIGAFAKSDVSLATGYANGPYIFYIIGICLILTLVLFVFEKFKHSKLVKNKEYKEVIEEIDQRVKESMETLGVPEDAKSIDVFSYSYKESKKGKIIINTNTFFKYLNTSLFVYTKNDSLCFANAYEEISIPLASLVEIKKINKKAMVGGWNKEESYKSSKYKKYKITCNNFGTIYVKPYYSIIINDTLGQFEFFVPCYDIDEIVKLTKLSIDDIQ